MKVKQESEKAGLKINIQKTKIMASGPITSGQIEGETMETATDLIFLGSKSTVDGYCSCEIKRCLLLGRKAMINLDSIWKSRDITLPTKVPTVPQPCRTLRPHGLQHAKAPCPSPTPGACSNSCPSSRWCHPTISSSVIPFSSCLQSFPASGAFPMSQFFTSGGQNIGISASASVLPMNFRVNFL